MWKILIVEDDPEMREFLHDVVEMLGYSPVLSATGKEGVSQARVACPDLVVQDIMLPDIDGWEAMNRIRSEEKCEAIPFIFCSGSVQAQEEFRENPPGNASFLTKPFDIGDLESEIKKYMDRSVSGR